MEKGTKNLLLVSCFFILNGIILSILLPSPEVIMYCIVFAFINIGLFGFGGFKKNVKAFTNWQAYIALCCLLFFSIPFLISIIVSLVSNSLLINTEYPKTKIKSKKYRKKWYDEDTLNSEIARFSENKSITQELYPDLKSAQNERIRTSTNSKVNQDRYIPKKIYEQEYFEPNDQESHKTNEKGNRKNR